MRDLYFRREFATLLLLLCCAIVKAHDFVVDGIYYNFTSNTYLTVEVTYKGSSADEYSNEYSGNVVIPASVICRGTTYSVMGIGEAAFAVCDNVTSVTISYGVTSIGDYAFSGCTGLTNVTIGNSVTSIGTETFYNCSALANITIPNSVTSIGTQAFDCKNLTNVYISDLTAWCNIDFGNYNGANPLYRANNLYLNNKLVTDLVIPETVTKIKDFAFSGYDGIGIVSISNNVTSIGDYAFYDCDSIKNVTIGNGVTSIGEFAFCGCDSIKNVTIGNGVTSIGCYAFEVCNSLTGVHISDIAAWCNIDFGDYRANPLYYAKSLYLNNKLVTDLVIPETVTKIKDYAFNYCKALTCITIPSNVTSIGYDAFFGCEALTEVYSMAETPASTAHWSFDDYSATLYVPTGRKALYKASYYWCKFTNIVEMDFTGIKTVSTENRYRCLSDNYYDLNGRIVKNPAKGIYIRNGKTILVQ